MADTCIMRRSRARPCLRTTSRLYGTPQPQLPLNPKMRHTCDALPHVRYSTCEHSAWTVEKYALEMFLGFPRSP